MGSVLRASVRLVLYLLWTLPLVPIQFLAVALKLRLATTLPLLYHRVCLRIIGLQEIVRGKMETEGAVLFVANHSSYLDITILGAVIPGSFISKAEVADWPLFGILAKLQRTVFVERAARRKVARQKSELMERLAAGDKLVLFPEGTSDNGVHVLPFKSALLSAAEEEVG